ncbi:SphA family protein, partial [Dokdonella sp.]|uniref:SphA family protein n=1 Tax=Dokdonella sp. TaxID=2291710 RepID=UPI003C59FF2C
AYNSQRLANLGIGHGAVDVGGGYTYFDEKTGREFSAVLGLTYNMENDDTHYKNGVDSHLDWAASQFLSANWQVGVAGYVYYQLTGDSGSGAQLGSFKSRVAGIGPEVGYVFAMGGKEAYANLRGYYEFWARNRVEGYAVFATLAIPLK